MEKLNFEYADLVGKPFRDGGRGPDAYDCWGLAKEVFTRAGWRNLPDYPISCYDAANISRQIDEERPQWIRLDAPEAPCLIAIRFNTVRLVNHCAVYIGNGKMLHIREKTAAVIERIDSIMWRRRIEGYYILKGARR